MHTFIQSNKPSTWSYTLSLLKVILNHDHFRDVLERRKSGVLITWGLIGAYTVLFTGRHAARWQYRPTVNWGDFGPNKKKVILWRHDITIYDTCFCCYCWYIYTCLSVHHALFLLATCSVQRWASKRWSPIQNTCLIDLQKLHWFM